MPKKTKNIYRGFIDQCPFDLEFTCWANNHNGRSKAKNTIRNLQREESVGIGAKKLRMRAKQKEVI